MSILSYAIIANDVSLLNEILSGTFSNQIFNLVSLASTLLTAACAVIFFPAIAIRSKWDRMLRRHFVWFALFGILFVFLTGLFLVGPAAFSLFFPSVLFTALSLYKSAKALIPLNRIYPLTLKKKNQSGRLEAT